MRGGYRAAVEDIKGFFDHPKNAHVNAFRRNPDASPIPLFLLLARMSLKYKINKREALNVAKGISFPQNEKYLHPLEKPFYEAAISLAKLYDDGAVKRFNTLLQDYEERANEKEVMSLKKAGQRITRVVRPYKPKELTKEEKEEIFHRPRLSALFDWHNADNEEGDNISFFNELSLSPYHLKDHGGLADDPSFWEETYKNQALYT